MFGAIMAGLLGAFELTAASTVALLFVWFIFAIFFARFGGLKPFFAASETTTLRAAGVEGSLSEDASTRRLISVGAEVDEAQSLFGEREPISTDDVNARTPIFDEDDQLDTSDLNGPRTPLFGEALSDRLESERGDGNAEFEDSIGEEGASIDGGIKWAEAETDDDETAIEAEHAVETDEDPNDGETVSGLGIEVDENPDWVAGSAGAEQDGDTDDVDELAAHELEADDADLDKPTAEVDNDLTDVEAGEATDSESAPDPVEVVEEAVIDENAIDEALEVVEGLASESTPPTVGIAGTTDNVDLEDIDAERLAAALDSLAPADPSTPPVHVDYVSEPVVTASTGLSVGSGTELPVVVQTTAPLELHKYSSSEIMAVVKTQEGHLVDTLIDEGVLSTQGPLTDKDIRTMVFVAVSSTELIEVLTAGQQEAVALNGGGNHALESGS